jgi:hypothetical protein
MFPEHDAYRHHQRGASKLWETTTRTVRRLDEILAEKLDNVRNFKTHAAKMQNAFSIGTASGIPMDEITRIKLLRTSILGHHAMDKLIEGYDHDYPELLQQTFAGLCDYLNTHLPNAESREADTKAHGLSVQHKDTVESCGVNSRLELLLSGLSKALCTACRHMFVILCLQSLKTCRSLGLSVVGVSCRVLQMFS